MSERTPTMDELRVDRRKPGDRRTLADRRQPEMQGQNPPHVQEERRQGNRRKVERRRLVDPTTCERDYSPEEIEFMRAMDDYKRRSGRQFPTWSEVLEVLESLGYRKVCEPTELKL